MEVNESHSPVFNRPFVRITDGSEETGDYLFVDIEVRQAIALRDALLERYPLPVQPSALQRLEEWRNAGDHTRAYSVQAGHGVFAIWRYDNGHRLEKSTGSTLENAVQSALDEAEGGE